MARIDHPQTIRPAERPHPNLLGLLIICCLPLAAIAVILFTAGGTSLGFLIPALTCGVMIGMLVFMYFWDSPPR